MKLLYGTGNPAKLAAMAHRLAGLGIELIGLRDLPTPPPAVAEDGRTPLENARKKALAYYEAFRMPVFSCDSGLYFDNVPEEEQPGVHVRTVGGKTLTDEEMLAHYAGLAKKHGKLTARYKNAICLVLGPGQVHEAMDPAMASAAFTLLPTPHPRGILKKGFPLDCLSADPTTGRYFYDMSEADRDRVAVEDGFLTFFKKYICEEET